MAGMKKLINGTSHDLKVTLIVRKGDHPSENAGSVQVHLPAEPASEDSVKGGGEQDVTYGNDVDIYLNGIDVTMVTDGSAVRQRRVVVERGSELDNALNTNDTIEFLFDGENVLISATNSTHQPFGFAAE